MKSKAKILNLFPAGNTTQGFYSHFQYILPQEEANHLISIKGGPGVGKSSLMKKIGKKFNELGYDVEYHHCSSDPDSLDGVVIPDLKVALLDGTAPHVVDPRNPGAVDEILNLGDYWNEDELKENKSEIVRINTENGRLFNKAYGYLKASGCIYENLERTALSVFEEERINEEVANLIKRVFDTNKIINKNGKQRHLFGFGITPKGIINYRNDLLTSVSNRYVIKEDIYSSSENIMNQIKTQATIRGLDITCFHSPIKVDKIVDILIPELDTIISIDNQYYKYSFDYDYCLDITSYIDTTRKEHIQNEVNDDIKNFEYLLDQALNFIKRAKLNHDVLEEYYIKSMNFDEYELLLDNLVNKLLQYK